MFHTITKIQREGNTKLQLSGNARKTLSTSTQLARTNKVYLIRGEEETHVLEVSMDNIVKGINSYKE